MNKTFVYLSLFSVILSGCAVDPLRDFDNSYSIVGDDKVIAFVGRKISVAQLLEKPAEHGGDEVVINLDIGFAARYRILELVHGAYAGDTIDFVAYDHYGFPRFAEPDVAMVYVAEQNGRLYHQKYQWDEVHRTRSGRYAACGDWYYWLDEEDRAEVEHRPLEEIDFDPPVTVRISGELKSVSDRDRYSTEEVAQKREEIEAYYSTPVFDVKSGVATCKMGVYPDELFRIRYETVIRPRARRNMCEDEVGFTGADWMNEQKKAAVEACVNEKRAKGLPQ